MKVAAGSIHPNSTSEAPPALSPTFALTLASAARFKGHLKSQPDIPGQPLDVTRRVFFSPPDGASVVSWSLFLRHASSSSRLPSPQHASFLRLLPNTNLEPIFIFCLFLLEFLICKREKRRICRSLTRGRRPSVQLRWEAAAPRCAATPRHATRARCDGHAGIISPSGNLRHRNNDAGSKFQPLRRIEPKHVSVTVMQLAQTTLVAARAQTRHAASAERTQRRRQAVGLYFE